MNYHNVSFEAAYGLHQQIPVSRLPEVAFSGRSNVGKSSLINRLLGRKALARVSSEPGKTVTINFYNLDGQLHLVDLPGYGYAKVGMSDKKRWSGLIEGYLKDEKRMLGMVVQLVDMRHPPSAQDKEMIQFLTETGTPFIILLTKADKLNKTERQQRLASIGDEIPELPEDTVILPFSSKTGEGVDELRGILEQLVAFCAEHPELMPETDEEPEDAEPATTDDTVTDENPDEEEVTVEYIGFDDEE